MRMSKAAEAKVIGERHCLMCGNPFQITWRQNNKVYCDECSFVRYKQQKKEYEARRREAGLTKGLWKKYYKPKRRTVVCERCGEEFKMAQGRSTICIKCLINSPVAAERTRGELRRDYSSEEQVRVSG